ncbi:hypothetical protein [Aquibium pacificus]|uniref:hypothetical protein n=1 Tax=Aquibium pacificus TaxID=3153579 RepID=UPI00349F653C
MAASKTSKGAKARKTKKAPRRTAVLILGMHRSGTSALARVVNLLGCDLPQTIMAGNPYNEAGHWESEPIRQLNDRILKSAGSGWDDWLELNPGWFSSAKAEEFREEAVATLNAEYGTSRLFVMKDPRISRLLPFWLDVLEASKVAPAAILPLRNPIEVAASLQRRDGLETELSQLLWLRHVLDAEAASRDIPRLFSTYDQLMKNWSRVAKDAQKALGIAWPRFSNRTAEDVEAFLSASYRHHTEAPETVTENPNLSEWLRDTYSILLDWSRTEERPGDRPALDDIRANFNAASPAFARLIETGRTARTRVVRLEKTVSENAGKLAAAQDKVSELHGEATRRAEALKEAQAKLRATEAASAAAEQKARKLEQELALSGEHIEQSRNKISELVTEIARRTAALNDIRERAGAAEETLAAAEQRAAQLEEDLAVSRGRMAEEQTKLAELAAETARRTTALNAVRERASTAEAASAAIAQKAKQLEGDLSASQERVEEAETKLGELAAEIARRTAALNDVQERANAAAQKSEQLEEELAASRRRIEEGDTKLADLQAEIARRTAALNDFRERMSVAEQELSSLRQQAGVRERQLSGLQSELEKRSAQAATTAVARAEAEAKLAASEAAAAEDRTQAAQRLAELSAELDTEIAQREAAEREAQTLRDKLSETSSALAQRRLEVEQTAAELTSACDALQQTSKLLEEATRRTADAEALLEKTRTESQQLLGERTREISSLRDDLGKARHARIETEKTAAGLKEQVSLLLSDMKDLRAKNAAQEAARKDAESGKADALSEVESVRQALAETQAASARQTDLLEEHLQLLRSELSDANADTERLRSQAAEEARKHKLELEKARNDFQAQLAGQREEAERQLMLQQQELDRVRRAGMEERGRIIGYVLGNRMWRLLPRGLRLRGQMALLRRARIVDPDWYLSRNEDVAKAGVDPLRHYIEFGVREGREPNSSLR